MSLNYITLYITPLYIEYFYIFVKKSMDTLLNYYFEMFDALIENSNGVLTSEIELKIIETREKLKDLLSESPNYTANCHYIDKKFDEYILKNKTK